MLCRWVGSSSAFTGAGGGGRYSLRRRCATLRTIGPLARSVCRYMFRNCHAASQAKRVSCVRPCEFSLSLSLSVRVHFLEMAAESWRRRRWSHSASSDVVKYFLGRHRRRRFLRLRRRDSRASVRASARLSHLGARRDKVAVDARSGNPEERERERETPLGDSEQLPYFWCNNDAGNWHPTCVFFLWQKRVREGNGEWIV